VPNLEEANKFSPPSFFRCFFFFCLVCQQVLFGIGVFAFSFPPSPTVGQAFSLFFSFFIFQWMQLYLPPSFSPAAGPFFLSPSLSERGRLLFFFVLIVADDLAILRRFPPAFGPCLADREHIGLMVFFPLPVLKWASVLSFV